MEKWTYWLVLLIGVLLLLPLIGVTQLGTITDGIAAWLVTIAVIIIGIVGLVKG